MDLVINFTPTGMIPTKDMTPHVPINVEEIINDVRIAVDIGITMVHLHARDEETGNPSFDSETYKQIILGIREFSKDLIICVSLSGRNFPEFAQRSEALILDGDAKPDMGSLTLSSLNFNKVESVNKPSMIIKLAKEMKERGILPELEVFDLGMINYAKYLEKKGLLESPHYFNILLGNIACAQADLLHAGLLIRDLPEESLWSLAGIGNSQLAMNSISIAIGGGVRVGLEDNIWYDSNRTELATNEMLLKRIHRIADVNNRKLMTSSDCRKLLNLKEGYGNYGLRKSKQYPKVIY